MTVNELDSFLGKFKHLWHAGLKASLNLEAENGEASITLKVGLGYIPPPHSFQGPNGQSHRGPAYRRRQERRKAAKLVPHPAKAPVQEQEKVDNVDERDSIDTLAEEVIEAEKAVAAEKAVVAEKVTEADEINQAEEAKVREKDKRGEEARNDKVAEEVTGNARGNEAPKRAEQAAKEFNCELCDFRSSWKNGLSVHMTKKHSKIEQLDGNSDTIEAENDDYQSTKHYWASGYLGTAYQTYLDAVKIIDNSDMNECEKEKENFKILEARRQAFGPNFKNFPPWSR